MEKNLETYRSADVVEEYFNKNFLQPPERTIIKNLESVLMNMKVLDIGVGAGRTVQHLASLSKEYIGIDYSEGMVDACKKRYSDFTENISFEVCDVRSMKIFKNNDFDFILFSFNGIDYISDRERSLAFKEIQRVGKPGGYFCFSSHNLNSVYQMFDFRRFMISLMRRMLKNTIIRILKFVKRNLIRNVSEIKLATAKKILSDPSTDYSFNISFKKWLILRFKYNKKTGVCTCLM